ncbi:hypothetical protein PQC65_gp018 [Aeromonas phage pAEv1810]|uniref:hypothetical protein n=1 Tax=Aeromonas phage pAEv1810 TaxID=2908744 RepID=UPI0023293263|nr:hypothetical protein PQC65_gp018 [Aeromonas phage pAEv1810]UIS24956.1 hypothetical protein pAEv1810_18 [Aeromonas phage pAEv1810]
MTNNKYLQTTGAFFGILFLFAFIYIFEVLAAKDEVKPIGITQAQMEKLSSRFEGDLGEPVTVIPKGKLGVEYGRILPNITAIRFYDRETDDSIHHPITLMCNARTQTLLVNHDLEYRDYADEYSVSEFSIRHYAKGTTTVFEADENRVKPFSTNIGDRNLKEAIEYIMTLPGDDLISLVVEEPVVDDDYATFGSAYSPMYTVAEFTYLVKLLNLNDCVDVELKQKPVYNKQA